MLKNNLLNVLKSFTPKEMKEFRNFLTSPFHNTNKNVVSFFDILRKHYPEFDAKALEKEKIFAKIYKAEKYKDSKIRLLIFYLNESAEKFMANMNLVSDELGYKVALLRELKKRNLSASFEKTLDETYEEIKSTKIKDSGYMINKFHLDIMNQNYFSSFPNNKYHPQIGESDPEKIFQNLTDYYSTIAFELYEVLITAEHLFERKFNAEVFEKIINEFDKSNYAGQHEILCRYYLCMLWREPDNESVFYELKELLDTNEDSIRSASINAAAIGLKNFCVVKIKRGEKKFKNEFFDLIKKELENKFYMEDGFMNHMFFRNAVSIGSGLGQFEWTRNFIEKYRHELHADMRQPMYRYTLAFLETEMGNYDEALKHLAKVKTDEIFLKVAMRILQCRLYYELDWEDQVNSLVDSTRHFIAKDKILTPALKEFYYGYFKAMKKLINKKNIEDGFRLDQIKTEIERSTNLHGKDWLLAKIDDIQKRS